MGRIYEYTQYDTRFFGITERVILGIVLREKSLILAYISLNQVILLPEYVLNFY